MPDDSALRRKIAGPPATWRTETHLLAGIFDGIQGLLWQNGSSPQRPLPKPKPFPRPKRPDAGELTGRTLRDRIHDMYRRHGREVPGG